MPLLDMLLMLLAGWLSGTAGFRFADKDWGIGLFCLILSMLLATFVDAHITRLIAGGG